ncbi:uncharacterized protein LOC115810457 [Chanos chanos]|uniref:Uncharacterized protein LOC115810457 n=1 Tax=Chanos chanos TaxID=29144 RepID=A0A6J2V927_CHACN|nr:uncharacterized protein LOC115810457 [Chanos chanos]
MAPGRKRGGGMNPSRWPGPGFEMNSAVPPPHDRSWPDPPRGGFRDCPGPGFRDAPMIMGPYDPNDEIGSGIPPAPYEPYDVMPPGPYDPYDLRPPPGPVNPMLRDAEYRFREDLELDRAMMRETSEFLINGHPVNERCFPVLEFDHSPELLLIPNRGFRQMDERGPMERGYFPPVDSHVSLGFGRGRGGFKGHPPDLSGPRPRPSMVQKEWAGSSGMPPPRGPRPPQTTPKEKAKQVPLEPKSDPTKTSAPVDTLAALKNFAAK